MNIAPASQSDINAVLAQMRQVRAQAQLGLQAPAKSELDAASKVEHSGRADFGNMVKSAIDQVNQLQSASSQTANDFLTGKNDDLVKVMVDSQKAGLGFQAVVQVRNRMVSAYQDIMKMPI